MQAVLALTMSVRIPLLGWRGLQPQLSLDVMPSKPSAVHVCKPGLCYCITIA